MNRIAGYTGADFEATYPSENAAESRTGERERGTSQCRETDESVLRDVLCLLFWPVYGIAVLALGFLAWRAWPWL